MQNGNSDDVADLSSVEMRINGLKDWLRENAPECFSEQKHLHENTAERVYWHYGYMVALRDVMRLLQGERLSNRNLADKHSSFPSELPDAPCYRAD